MNYKHAIAVLGAFLLIFGAANHFVEEPFSALNLSDSCEWEPLETESGETFETLEEASQHALNHYNQSLTEIDHAQFEVRDGVVHGKLDNCQVQTGEVR
jgi:hypothetical protein